MKRVDLIFNKKFNQATAHDRNHAARYFWHNVAKFLESSKTSAILTGESVLKEYFSTGYEAANSLKCAYRQATHIKVIHHLDGRNLPAVKAIFFITSENCFYELTACFDAATGKPLLISRSEKTQIMGAAA